jgi:hypothetical protein
VKIGAEIEEECEFIDTEAKGKLEDWTETETELVTVITTETIGLRNEFDFVSVSVNIEVEGEFVDSIVTSETVRLRIDVPSKLGGENGVEFPV